MKVRLERKWQSCPPELQCIVCREKFEPQEIRALICNNQGLIQGDVCPNCLKLKAKEIKQKLNIQAQKIKEQIELDIIRGCLLSQDSLDLLESLEEDFVLPTFSQWFFKRLEIFSQESQELEIARLGLAGCPYSKKSKLRISFE